MVPPALIAPGPAQTLRGEVTFRWQPALELASGLAYEVVWWNVGEDPAGARGIAPPTTSTSLVANLDPLAAAGQFRGSELLWAVVIVRTQPYQRLTVPAATSGRSMFYTPQGAIGGEVTPAPPPPPK